MKITQEQLDTHNLVREQVREMGVVYRESFLNHNYSLDTAEIDGDEIDFVFEHTCCGSADYEHVSIPTSYLFKENWFEVERQKREDKKKAEWEAESLRVEAKKIEEKHKRHQQFLSLKQEFEGEVK